MTAALKKRLLHPVGIWSSATQIIWVILRTLLLKPSQKNPVLGQALDKIYFEPSSCTLFVPMSRVVPRITSIHFLESWILCEDAFYSVFAANLAGWDSHWVQKLIGSLAEEIDTFFVDSEKDPLSADGFSFGRLQIGSHLIKRTFAYDHRFDEGGKNPLSGNFFWFPANKFNILCDSVEVDITERWASLE